MCSVFLDSKSNEMLITSLKSAMEEQEETMQSQDTVLQNKEEEITTLSKGWSSTYTL